MSPALEKVRKLLALAGSDNENEARSAALSAARLIKKHGFEVVDQAPPVRTPPDFFAKRPAPPSERGTYRNDRPRGGPSGEDLEAFIAEVIRGRDPFGPFGTSFGNRQAPPPAPRDIPPDPGREHRQDLDRRPLGRDEVRTCSRCGCRVAHCAFWTSRPYSPPPLRSV